jgi:hypothetical protein
MRRKVTPLAASAEPDDLRDELERLGLAPADAGELAARLEGLSGELPVRDYLALLGDAVLTPRSDTGGQAPKTPEFQRLVEDFASELKKLDEGLRVLMAFLTRLRDHAAVEVPKTLH